MTHRSPGPVAARVWHGAVALAVAVAVIVQIVVALRTAGTPPSTATGLLRGTSPGGRLIRVFSFFTVQSNLLSGVVSLLLAIRPHRDGRGFRALRLAALIGITVTGIVYSAVLAAVHEPHGAAETLVNDLLHYVVPIAMVLGWLLFGPRPRVDAATAGGALLFPLAWIGYTLVRGAIWHWYPYPFLDVTTHGYLRVAVNGVGVTVVLAVVIALFALGDRKLPVTENVSAGPTGTRGRPSRG